MTLSIRAWVSTRFLTFFVSWAVFQSYWGLWLAGRGFSVAEIGTAVACSLVARSITVAAIYPALNRHATLLRLSRVVPWLITAMAVPYILVTGFPLLIAVSVVFGLIYPIMLPLNETVATVAARQKLLPYGPTRALGSAGFMIGTLVAGWLASALGTPVLVYALIGSCLLMALVGFIHPREAAALDLRGSGAHGFVTLLRNRAFLACLTIATLVQGSHAAYYSFGAIRAGEIASPTAVPLLLVLAPLSEFALFSLARARFESLGYRSLFAIGALVATGRWTLLAFASNWEMLAFSQLLHAGSYATTHLAFAMYVRDHIDVDDQGAAQGLYASLAMGLGTAVLTFVAGQQLSASFSSALLTMAGAAIVSLVFLPLARTKRKATS
ncbi:MFS transporter [Microbacterium sp. VKM Ac-2870]|uniref:MFS transporter n=1 Tax=Microbacterium sp. VKM Ac-2870 TaxID=2783825 RepID=UPI00188C1A93|nr:MFS transporter [Microbacterium sp. VKM Ac-2870]MBF4561176.1 MFS transporter [Microbacterium sp. VKM Ac-2870]